MPDGDVVWRIKLNNSISLRSGRLSLITRIYCVIEAYVFIDDGRGLLGSLSLRKNSNRSRLTLGAGVTDASECVWERLCLAVLKVRLTCCLIRNNDVLTYNYLAKVVMLNS